MAKITVKYTIVKTIKVNNTKGLVSKNGANGGTYAQHDIAFKFASWVSVEFENSTKLPSNK